MAMRAPSPLRRAFADLVRKVDPQIDLARAALLIAQEEYPALHPDHYLVRLDAIAAQVEGRLTQDGVRDPQAAPGAAIAALNTVLFDDLGFQRTEADYQDPRNSFLNEVLDRRIGLPITISLVYMAVAARVGLPLSGVGLPGHFIVRSPGAADRGPRPALQLPEAEFFIDPYHRGILLTPAECAAYFQRFYGPDFIFSAEYLTPLTHRQILARILGNLKRIYLRRRDYARAVAVVDRLLLIPPRALRGPKGPRPLHYRLGAFRPAITDLRRYLKQD